MVFRTGSCVINRSSVIRSRLGGCRTAGALRSDISRIQMLFSGGTDEKHEAALHALPCDLLQPSNYRTHPRRSAVVIGVGMGVPLPCWCWLLRRGSVPRLGFVVVESSISLLGKFVELMLWHPGLGFIRVSWL